jgi:hypothetical protein
MTTTTTTDNLANVPHPAGATAVHEWDPYADTATTTRYFRGGSWVIERADRAIDMCLQVDGIQHADGRVERFVVLDDDNMTAALARRLAAALVEAADEVERTNGYDEITVS